MVSKLITMVSVCRHLGCVPSSGLVSVIEVNRLSEATFSNVSFIDFRTSRNDPKPAPVFFYSDNDDNNT